MIHNIVARSEDMALAIGAKKLHEGRQLMNEATKKYHDAFKDSASGYFRSEFLENRNCPACTKKTTEKSSPKMAASI